MAGEIYVDPNATGAAVIRVGGSCYVQVGVADQGPQDVQVEDEFDDCDSCQKQYPCFPDGDRRATDAEVEAMYPDVVAMPKGVSCCGCFVGNTTPAECLEFANFTLNGLRLRMQADPLERDAEGHCRYFRYASLYYGPGDPRNQPPGAINFIKTRTHYSTTTCEETGYGTPWDELSEVELGLRICCTPDGWQWRTTSIGIHGEQDIFNNVPNVGGWLGQGGIIAVIRNGIERDGDCDGTTGTESRPCGSGVLYFFAVAPGIP